MERMLLSVSWHRSVSQTTAYTAALCCTCAARQCVVRMSLTLSGTYCCAFVDQIPLL